MENGQVQPSLAVAIDKDKGSQIAVKWTVDNLVSRGQTIILIHVKTKAASTNPNCSSEVYAKEFFLPFRCFCSRKDVHCKDVILEDNEVAKAVTDFVSQNVIVKLVVGAPIRNAFPRFKTSSDIPTTILKGAPDFFTVYVISRGKVSSLRNATRPAPSVSLLWHQLQNQMSAKPETINPMLLPAIAKVAAADSTLARRSFDEKETIKSPFSRRGMNAKSYGEITLPETDISFVSTGRPSMDRMFPSLCDDDHDINGHPPRLSDASNCRGFETMCSPRRSTDAHMMGKQPSSTRTTMDDMEAEMRRLRLELKQTMDMYSTACKEALLAKKKAGELRRWRKEEERRLHEAKLAEEAALAIAAKEKEKCKVALEAAEAAQKVAKLESEKRINAEKKAQKEVKERKRAMESLVNANVRYRKYTIEEIEVATEYFAQNRKIGEGGYGPVYMCNLDHTPVAIKVLRPDAAQGRSQFQQEVGVLSCIRHPNMVLLLGACSEYGCLVYEYMANGSLDDRLFRRGNTPVLPWQLRFRIATEIATALLFLHQTKPEPLVHRDLKPANILLDSNYVSKISDVGLARLVPPSVADSVTQYRLTSTAGTFCYIDPEYQQTGMLGRKSDIYSLGILLLQMITVKPPMGVTHHVARAIERGAFEEVLDKEVKDWPVEEALVFAKLALKCAELRRKDRPDLEEHILPELERLRAIADQNLHHHVGLVGVANNNSVAPPMMHRHLPNQAHDVLTETHDVPSEISRTSTSSSHEKN